MPPLHRHQLAFLSAAGWCDVLGRPWEAEERDCIAHWADRHLPLVVTRQHAPRSNGDAPISLGLSASARWRRRHVAVQLPPSGVAWFSEFPVLQEAVHQLPRPMRPTLQALAADLAAMGVRARAYGSVGWQSLTGVPYLHGRSDLDLWLAVDEAAQADDAVAALERRAPRHLRLDGELMFTDGSAVAWREWAAWRSGRCRTLLVKRLFGCGIEPGVGRYTPAFARPCAA